MFADSVMESSSTTGTGTYTLVGAVGASRSFEQDFADGATIGYFVSNLDKTKWEECTGVLTYGPPRTLTRTVKKSSNAGAAIDWLVGDTYYIFSIASADALAGVLKGNLATTRPWWASAAGSGWLDYTLGIAVAWVKKRWTGSVDIEEGRHYITPSIFAASQRALFVDKGAAAYAFTADDIGKVLCFDTTASVRALTMLAASATGMGHGAYVFVAPYGSTTNGVTFTPGGSDTTALATAPPGRITKFKWDGAKNTWRADYVAPPAQTVYTAWAGVRQTVASGPVDSSGLPTFLPSTAGTLNLTTQNVDSTHALIASAAGGWNQTNGLPVDTVGYAVANFTWSGLTASRAAGTPNFLYATIAGGALTPLSTLLAPIYQRAGTPATTAGQITFNISEMKAYLGNGASAPQTNLVVFGEAATDGVSVISTVMYAYNSHFEGAFTPTLPAASTAVAATHNIGVAPRMRDFIIECTSADKGYAVGDQLAIHALYTSQGSVYMAPSLSADAKTMSIIGNFSGPWWAIHKSTGADTPALDPTKWRYKLIASRGW
jgi:hypothetical protein